MRPAAGDLRGSPVTLNLLRRPVVVSSMVLLVITPVIIAGCASKGKGNKTGSKSKPTSTQPALEQSTAPEQPPPYTLQGNTLTGTADQETRTFELGGNPVTFRFVYAGGNPGFDATLVDFLTNAETGVVEGVAESNFYGSRTVSVPAGTYFFRVRASGPWTITIEY